MCWKVGRVARWGGPAASKIRSHGAGSRGRFEAEAQGTLGKDSPLAGILAQTVGKVASLCACGILEFLSKL